MAIIQIITMERLYKIAFKYFPDINISNELFVKALMVVNEPSMPMLNTAKKGPLLEKNACRAPIAQQPITLTIKTLIAGPEFRALRR